MPHSLGEKVLTTGFSFSSSHILVFIFSWSLLCWSQLSEKNTKMTLSPLSHSLLLFFFSRNYLNIFGWAGSWRWSRLFSGWGHWGAPLYWRYTGFSLQSLCLLSMGSRGHLCWAGIKPASLHWQADSVPLSHREALFYSLNITQNSIFVNQWMDPWLPRHPIILCFLNVYLIQTINLEKNEDPVRINPMGSLIRCPFLSLFFLGVPFWLG